VDDRDPREGALLGGLFAGGAADEGGEGGEGEDSSLHLEGTTVTVIARPNSLRRRRAFDK
jgi:hypothetical protein